MLRNPYVVGFFTFLALAVIVTPLLGEARCRDGWRSPSIGSQGACSHHGGVGRREGSWMYWIAIAGGIATGFATASRNERNSSTPIAPRPSTSERPPLMYREPESDDGSGIRCPDCGGPTVKRLAKRGRYRGKSFWGCKRYPHCGGIVNVDEATRMGPS